MAEQKSLFENELFAQPQELFAQPQAKDASDGLVLLSRPGRPLTKAQRAFNRLVAKVEGLRSGLEAETRRLDEALAYYGAHLHPRLQRQTALRKDLVRAFAPFLKEKRLKRKSERETLRAMIAEQMQAIVEDEGSLADDDLRALFERIHGFDFAQIQREQLDDVRGAMEEMFDSVGIDIDLSDLQPDMGPEQFAAKAAELEETLRQKAEEEESQRRGPERRKTKRQMEKEERMRQGEQLRKKSLATIYKQLAKVLHPDLEQDAGQRDRKVILMQQLTNAYHSNDLHTLLRLELEWIEREKGDLDRLSEEKLAIYTEVLKEQASELELELAELPYHPRYQLLAVTDGPFQTRLRTDGPGEARELDKTIANLEEIISRIRTGPALDEVRYAIRTYRLLYGN